MKKQHYLLILFLLLFAIILLTACTHEHEYGAWTLEKASTCAESGIQVRNCQCGQKETCFVPATDHTEGAWEIVAEPTCIADGLKQLTCSNCEFVLKVAAIPAADHIEGDWVTIAEPTCTVTGLKYQTCADCKLVLQVSTIPYTDHTEGEWITDREPTTTQEGSKRQICATCSATLKTEQIPALSKFIVILDAGHGGKDPGSIMGGVYEKSINLQITHKMKAILERQGVAVILTREDDVFLSLEERAELANTYNAQLFVSVHCNSFVEDASVKGFEIYYYQDPQAKSVADTIMSDLSSTGQVKTRKVKIESYYVLKNTTMPAILLEMGFLTNEEEYQKLCSDEYQNMLAESIGSSIVRFLDQNN